MIAQAQLGLVQPGPDGTITVPGPDGKAIKIPQAALMNAAPTVPNMGGNDNAYILNSIHICQYTFNISSIV